jgi:hypothetical protein
MDSFAADAVEVMSLVATGVNVRKLRAVVYPVNRANRVALIDLRQDKTRSSLQEVYHGSIE